MSDPLPWDIAETGPQVRKHAPATLRNRDAITQVLRAVLPERGRVLEIASGTGQHAVHFAAALPALEWQPSDIDPELRASVEAWRAEAGLSNLRAPVDLDVTRTPWPVEAADAIINANMIHIAPWDVCIGLLDGAARLLPEGGILYMYGPYKISGEHTAPSNAQFDQSLRLRDPSWGIRNLDQVVEEAGRRGLDLIETVEMPANDLSVVYRKTTG